jgi:hypothetical protein
VKKLLCLLFFLGIFLVFVPPLFAQQCPHRDERCGGQPSTFCSSSAGGTCRDYACVSVEETVPVTEGQPIRITVDKCVFTPTLVVPEPDKWGTRNHTDTTIEVYWQKIEGAYKYFIYYNAEGDATAQTKEVKAEDGTSVTLRDLKPSTTYFFQLEACNAKGECSGKTKAKTDKTAGGTTCRNEGFICGLGLTECCSPTLYCNAVSLHLPAGWCVKGATDPNASLKDLAPTNLHSSAATNDTIKLEWNGLQNATSYEIYYKAVSGPTVKDVEISSAYLQKTSQTVAVDLTGLPPSTTYTIYVMAVNNTGRSDKSNEITEKTTDVAKDFSACCSAGFKFDEKNRKCLSSTASDEGTYLCKSDQICNISTQKCDKSQPPPPCKQFIQIDERGQDIKDTEVNVTANENLVLDPYKNYRCKLVSIALFGDISTDIGSFIQRLFAIILGLSGGIAVILIIIGGYRIAFSHGNPEKFQAARDTITSAIVGLLFIIFSMVILRIIGFDILHIPGFQ